MEMDGTCDETREPGNISLPHSPLLDTKGRAETVVTQENLASNCRRGTQDPPSHLVGERSEAGSEQTRVGYL